ncbi:very long chain fatty acid elongase 7-like isoform 1-T6 [Glossina fuscipes fuscipes]
MRNNLRDLTTLLKKSRDSRIDDWLFMSSPGPLLLLLIVYLMIVLFIGPALMKTRKAFNLRRTLQVYNIIQIFYNLMMVIKALKQSYPIQSLFLDQCEIKRNDDDMLQLADSGWIYIVCKIIDLLDTIFFILRKKQNQITFLHVYHHTFMVLGSWIVLKYMDIRREEFGLCYILNCSVHVMMYFYYLVAAMGPQYQKFLWWKKYMTSIQLGQFLLILLYMAGKAIVGCQLSTAITLYVVSNASIFLWLFIDFYRKTYIKCLNDTILRSSSNGTFKRCD